MTNYSKSSTKISNRSDFGAFIPAFLDDYGLNPYEFRVYTHMARRAGKDGCFSSIPHMAKHCLMAEKVARKALHMLLSSGLIKKISDRPGKTDIYELTPIDDWLPPDQIPTKRGSGGRSATSGGGRSATSVVADQLPVVVADLPGEGTNNEGITSKGIPSKDLPPLTPQGAEEKKEEGSAALKEDPELKTAARSPHPLPEISRFVDQEKQDLAQDAKILPETKVPPRQVEAVPTTTAIEPFGNQRSGLAIAKERANGFPDGEWMDADGQIDKNFLEWMGKNYLKSGWGTNIHEAKRRVRGSWNNDPTRLALDWTWYTEEMGHRAANVAVQERAGISGAAVSEHKRFVEKHQRALTNPSPHASHEAAQELMDLASREFDPTHHPLDGTESPVVLPAEPDWDAIADRDSQAEQDYLSSDAYTPQQATTDAPRDEYGQTENVGAYKAYSPAQVESVPPPKDFLKRLNDLAEAREMKPVTERVGRRNARAPQKSPIELLNDMLAEPILRRDRSVQIRAEQYSSSGEYDVWRDEKGLIFKVEEVQF